MKKWANMGAFGKFSRVTWNSLAVFSGILVVLIVVIIVDDTMDAAERNKDPVAYDKKLEMEKRASLIERQFSPWNGSHRNLVREIKSRLIDPKSYEHIETTYYDSGDHLVVRTDYRARMVRGFLGGKFTIEGEIYETALGGCQDDF